MQIEQALAPPVGFRKAIPLLVKLKVVLRQNGKCTHCNAQLGELDGLEFDHVPALQLRIWCEETKDTIPPVNSVEHIEAKHSDCHDVKTYGSKATGRGSDITEIARTKRLNRETEEFRRRILAKTEGDDLPPSSKKKHRWPKRKFASRGRRAEEPERNQPVSEPGDE